MNPLWKDDSATMRHLEASPSPGPLDLADAGRLLSRYPAGEERQRLEGIIAGWGLTIESLREQTRALWGSGWRPSIGKELEIGSGADVTDD